MTTPYENAISALNNDYLGRYIEEASRNLSRASSKEIAEVILALPVHKAITLWSNLHPDIVEKILSKIPEKLLRELFMRADPVHVSKMLRRMSNDNKEFCMSLLSSSKSCRLYSIAAF